MTVPYYADESVTLYLGDCLDVLRTLPDASVDSVVTDPPYGLEFMGKDWDSFKGANDWGKAGDTATWAERPKGGGDPFSGRDRPRFTAGHPFQAWCQLWATECLRVLKPGGYLLAFGGTRTSHRLACAVEDAGFEIRDSIAWLYGSGFPKSLDVSKAIDKARHGREDVLRVTSWLASHTTASALDEAAGTNGMGGHWTTQGAQASIPTAEAWGRIAHLVPAAPSWLLDLIKPAREPGEAWAQREVLGMSDELLGRRSGIANGTTGHYTVGGTRAEAYAVTAPATPAAERWQGWGTALKPAFEPIVVGRKPLVGTVAANVLAWGTGALNIGACRVEGDDALAGRTRHGGGSAISGSMSGPLNPDVRPESPAGRWPTNVILDDSQAAELDRQSGTLHSQDPATRYRASDPSWSPSGAPRGTHVERSQATGADSGGASRFFPTFRYEAKAPTSERPRIKATGERADGIGYSQLRCVRCTRLQVDGRKPCTCTEPDFQPDARHGDAIAHPTVKPLDLMRWLVRLVTPPGGLVLDPFAGSGTTAEACVIEGFKCIAIEREATYLPLIVARLSKPIAPVLDFGASA